MNSQELARLTALQTAVAEATAALGSRDRNGTAAWIGALATTISNALGAPSGAYPSVPQIETFDRAKSASAAIRDAVRNGRPKYALEFGLSTARVLAASQIGNVSPAVLTERKDEARIFICWEEAKAIETTLAGAYADRWSAYLEAGGT